MISILHELLLCLDVVPKSVAGTSFAETWMFSKHYLKEKKKKNLRR